MKQSGKWRVPFDCTMPRTFEKSPKVAKKAAAKRARPTLFSGGNPQIAKAYGDAPVQAYIVAMSG